MARVTICLCRGCPAHGAVSCGRRTTNGARCPDCAGGRAGFAPGRRHPVYDTRAWRELSERIRAEWVALHGWVCPGWRVPAHPSRDLTADHIEELQEGGAPLDPRNVRVLCRSCNSRAGLSVASRRRRR